MLRTYALFIRKEAEKAVARGDDSDFCSLHISSLILKHQEENSCTQEEAIEHINSQYKELLENDSAKWKLLAYEEEREANERAYHKSLEMARAASPLLYAQLKIEEAFEAGKGTREKLFEPR